MLEPFVAITNRLLPDRLDMLSERGIPPVIARGLLGVARHAIARGFEQRLRGSCVERRVIARGQVKLAPGATSVVSIVVDKSA